MSDKFSITCRSVGSATARYEERVILGSLEGPLRLVSPAILTHDENSNGKADRALGMMPKEGFGFSRDAKVRMGPPRFSDAAIDIGAQDRNLIIRMRYML